MINIHDAIYALNPTVKSICDDIAYDQEGNEVAYNKSAAETKLTQLQAEEVAKKEAGVAAKESALSKLTALGLTQAEVTALVG
jgi:hypothetical protein